MTTSIQIPCDGECFDSWDILAVGSRYWKCPNENRCVHSEKFCNVDKGEYEIDRNLCSGYFKQSRELCENPDKYNFKPACGVGQVQCKGHRTGENFIVIVTNASLSVSISFVNSLKSFGPKWNPLCIQSEAKQSLGGFW